MSSKIGHVGSKPRPLGQILENPCVSSRGHIFSPILMNFCKNVCVDEILDQFEFVSCGSKTRSLGQILEKPCASSTGYVFSPLAEGKRALVMALFPSVRPLSIRCACVRKLCLQKTSPQKLLTGFLQNFTGMFLSNSFK